MLFLCDLVQKLEVERNPDTTVVSSLDIGSDIVIEEVSHTQVDTQSKFASQKTKVCTRINIPLARQIQRVLQVKINTSKDEKIIILVVVLITAEVDVCSTT